MIHAFNLNSRLFNGIPAAINWMLPITNKLDRVFASYNEWHRNIFRSFRTKSRITFCIFAHCSMHWAFIQVEDVCVRTRIYPNVNYCKLLQKCDLQSSQDYMNELFTLNYLSLSRLPSAVRCNTNTQVVRNLFDWL